MESSDRNIKNINFVSSRCNQVLNLGYNDLFYNRRVLVIALSNLYGNVTYPQMIKFNQHYEKIKKLGIDEIYFVSSDELVIGPWADKHSAHILGLGDTSKQFLQLIAEHCNQTTDINKLAQYWQYMAIIDNDKIEKVFYNYIKDGLALKIIKNEQYRYHGLGVDTIYKYLEE